MIVMGNRRAISTSKIRKITAIRKNRSENGIRADELGSNPHSKGDLFSRSIKVFFDRNEANTIMRVTMISVNIKVVRTKLIIYFIFNESSNWKSDIISYTK